MPLISTIGVIMIVGYVIVAVEPQQLCLTMPGFEETKTDTLMPTSDRSEA
jgi:hypothetical protein